jgi:hypothetical protein
VLRIHSENNSKYFEKKQLLWGNFTLHIVRFISIKGTGPSVFILLSKCNDLLK